jgi:leucyl aminopeptidase
MSQYRADMSSAAVLVAVMKTIAAMSLPINVNGVKNKKLP